MSDQAELDSLWRKLLQAVLACYPEWEQFVTYRREDPDQFRTGIIEVPQPGSNRSLWISTEEGEVTVGFGEWHYHESPWLEDEGADAEVVVVRRAVETVRDIIEERMAVLVESQNGTWTGSSLIEANELVELDPGERGVVFSWRGTHDREISSDRKSQAPVKGKTGEPLMDGTAEPT